MRLDGGILDVYLEQVSPTLLTPWPGFRPGLGHLRCISGAGEPHFANTLARISAGVDEVICRSRALAGFMRSVYEHLES